MKIINDVETLFCFSCDSFSVIFLKTGEIYCRRCGYTDSAELFLNELERHYKIISMSEDTATIDTINELADKSFAIIRESLESHDQYTRTKTALDFTQMLVVTAFSKRLESIERWSDNLTLSDSQDGGAAQ